MQRKLPETYRKPLFRTGYNRRTIVSRDLVMPIHPAKMAQSLETVFAFMEENERAQGK